MKKQMLWLLAKLGIALCLTCATCALAQYPVNRGGNFDTFVSTPAVSGYEQQLVSKIRAVLDDISPKTDNLGNVYVSIGTGKPHRLIVTPMDEPGYVVSEITHDGYLRVQRLPQRAPNAIFDLLHAAQPVWVMTRDGNKVPGVFTGLSVHLQPARQNPPTMAHPDEMFVDIGASNPEQAREAGVDLLDPIALARLPQKLGTSEITSPAAGDRFGCVVLADVLQIIHASKTNLSGTLTVAFAAQQWTGARGLERLLNEFHPDEMVYVGRLMPPREDPKSAPNTAAKTTPPSPGVGVLLATTDSSSALTGLPADLKKLGDDHQVAVTLVNAMPPAILGYAKPTSLPTRFAQVGISSLYPVTPAETLSSADMAMLEALLYTYATGSDPTVASVLTECPDVRIALLH